MVSAQAARGAEGRARAAEARAEADRKVEEAKAALARSKAAQRWKAGCKGAALQSATGAEAFLSAAETMLAQGTLPVDEDAAASSSTFWTRGDSKEPIFVKSSHR